MLIYSLFSAKGKQIIDNHSETIRHLFPVNIVFLPERKTVTVIQD